MMRDNRAVFLPASTVAFRKIGDSVVLVNIEDNTMIRLNETGSEIWASLDGKTVGQIATRIGELFDTTADQALADTREFLEMLHGRGLVEFEAEK